MGDSFALVLTPSAECFIVGSAFVYFSYLVMKMSRIKSEMHLMSPNSCQKTCEVIPRGCCNLCVTSGLVEKTCIDSYFSDTVMTR